MLYVCQFNFFFEKKRKDCDEIERRKDRDKLDKLEKLEDRAIE